MKINETINGFFTRTKIDQNKELAESTIATKKYKLTFKQKIYFGLAFIAGLIFVFTFSQLYNLGAVRITWGMSMFASGTRIFFLIIPFIVFIFVYVFRKKLRNIKQETQVGIMVTLGMMVFFWELLFDLTTLKHGNEYGHAVSYFQQFIEGFILCRLNMYILATALIFRRVEVLKWIAATSIFGGFTVLVMGNWDKIPLFSAFTHSIFLASFPSFVIAMVGTNYKVRNLIHAHLFNWTLVFIMLMVNFWINGGWEAHYTMNSKGDIIWDVSKSKYGFYSFAGELTKQHLGPKNPVTGWAKWPGSIFVWMLAVMTIEWLYFGLHRLVIWLSYQKAWSFKETYTKEYETDKVEWYGFKLWGENSFYVRRTKDFKEFKEEWSTDSKRLITNTKNIFKK